MTQLQTEASLFAQYLGAEKKDTQLQERYISGIELLNIKTSNKELAILNMLVKFPFLLPYIDGGFALLKVENSIRKKIGLMSALLETEPAFTALFLVEKDLSFAAIRFLYRGSIALLKSIIGAALIYLLKWR